MIAFDWSGYLVDPREPLSGYVQKDVVEAEAFVAFPCVVLLGEPGIGKSHEIRRNFGLASQNENVLFRDLRQYDSTAAIRDDIFLSEQFREWQASNGSLTLALDSLDEALLEIGVLATWLVDQLKRYLPSGLRLRIACRTAQWPQVIEQALIDIWGDEQVKVFELAPLTAKDVVTAAEAAGVDPSSFFAEVARHEVPGLANKPATLRFLLEVFAHHQALPHSRTELYNDGCLHLCEEDEERQVSGRWGFLTPPERIAVARRIAAATVFGNRSAIWRDSIHLAPSADVPLRELAGGVEPVASEQRLSVSERELTEALSTGLFSGRTEASLGWAHLTYAEFLAAQWSTQNNLSTRQIEDLVRHPGDPARHFVPQLRDTISWLAGMRPDFRMLVMETEPELLLKSDAYELSDTDRRALVTALLDAEAKSQRRWPDLWAPRHYDRLAHPDLAQQLRPIILDPERPEGVRELALEIATATRTAGLQTECAELALDRSAPLDLRVEAARLVAAAGDPETRARLRPLALEPQSDDSEDDLKGTALRAVWPGLISAEEMFAALSFPKVANRSGAYDRFFAEVEEKLAPDDLPVALRWAAEAAESLSARGRLAVAIVRMGWEYLDRPEVLEPFADLAALRYAKYQDLPGMGARGGLSEAIAAHPERRRKLVEALVARLSVDADVLASHFSHTGRRLVDEGDLQWLIDRAAGLSSDEPQGRAWSRLLQTVGNLNNPEVFALIYANRHQAHVAAAFSHYWTAIPLDSELAASLRKDQDEARTWERKHIELTQRERRRPSADRVIESLNEISESSTKDDIGDVWCGIDMEMELSDDGRYHTSRDLDKGTIWPVLEEGERNRILKLSQQYLETYAADVAEWLDRERPTLGLLAGYRGLRLLVAHRPDALQRLSTDVWKAWLPVVLREHPSSEDGDSVLRYHELLTAAYAAAPRELVCAVREHVRAEALKKSGWWSLTRFEPLWSTELGTELLNLARDPALPSNSMRILLDELLKQDVPGAVEFAESLLARPLPRGGVPRDRAVDAAAALLHQRPDLTWPSLHNIICGNSKLRRELALSIAHRGVPLNRLNEDQLADVFAWLTDEFPYPDPWYQGVYSPSAADEARHLRGDVLRALEARATPAAVSALERLKRRFPDLTWLGQTILRTRESVRHDTWAPPAVAQILALAESDARRLVESGEQLLDVLVESLERFQDELQGELPSVSSLWDNLGHGAYRPKDEQELSDAISRHLRRDLKDRGVVAGREVVIRRGGAGGAPGQRTDIYVTAVRPRPRGGSEPISVIMEVKGSWHSDVLTAMETQLTGDYLARNPECHHGLFVVGWYLCSRWKSGVPKRASAKLGSIENLQRILSRQAADLSDSQRTIRSFVLDAAWL